MLEEGVTEGVRVNEAGPVLRIEVIAAGDETTRALATSTGDPAIAHLRSEPIAVLARPSMSTMDR